MACGVAVLHYVIMKSLPNIVSIGLIHLQREKTEKHLSCTRMTSHMCKTVEKSQATPQFFRCCKIFTAIYWNMCKHK